MSAKRPQTEHAKALSAFVNKRITKAEYQSCCRGEAWISGAEIWHLSDWLGGFTRRRIMKGAAP